MTVVDFASGCTTNLSNFSLPENTDSVFLIQSLLRLQPALWLPCHQLPRALKTPFSIPLSSALLPFQMFILQSFKFEVLLVHFLLRSLVNLSIKPKALSRQRSFSLVNSSSQQCFPKSNAVHKSIPFSSRREHFCRVVITQRIVSNRLAKRKRSRLSQNQLESEDSI